MEPLEKRELACSPCYWSCPRIYPSGRPCIRGMRIRVSDVLELLGVGVDEILGDYPDLEREDIEAVLLWDAESSKSPS
ncbi:DUF433 domain-containing protein [Deinococcus planocerae]|uniref:DUF433 domain-containing protein n=1 Tax=Deinococcus planocerae TaxID=1737569 RepID=UPI002481D93D|nr:DUF433 domain-containing protein [Deinococcus planocerae]